MKRINILIIAIALILVLTACSNLERIQPELSDSDKQTCLSALETFFSAATKLDGETMKCFSLDEMMLMTNEIALEEYGEKMTDEQKNAYWAVAVMGDMLPKDRKVTDTQLMQMRISIDEKEMRGLMDSNVFISGKISFDGGNTSEKMKICMHMEPNLFPSGDFRPVISYITFVE